MHKPRLNPYRCARGGVGPFTSTNLATISVFNNSKGPELVIVWFLEYFTNATTIYLGSINQSLGTVQTTIAPLVTGNTVFAGQLFKLDTATVLPKDLAFELNPILQNTLIPRLPWAILQPGWSFFMQSDTSGSALSGSFIWQSAHMEDVIPGLRCAICEPEF
jgi:hypothetical protein